MTNSKSGVIVAFDHAPLGLLPGLDAMDSLLAQFVRYQIEGYIVNYGVLKHLTREISDLSITPIARLDGNHTYLGGDWTKSPEWEMFYSVEACQKVGARAAIVNLLLGSPAELASLRVVAKAAAACREGALPLFVSAMCFCKPAQHSAENSCHAFAARMAYELGADVVNVYGTSDANTIKEVRHWCPLPLYVQGAPVASDGDLTYWARECVGSGAKGVIVGRAAWQSPDPNETVRQLIAALEY
jgi:fructose-bisphosphate aldolase, class I